MHETTHTDKSYEEENAISSLVAKESRLTWNLEMMLDELGMGMFQYVTIILYGIAILYSSFSYIGFVFTAADIDYRCFIPECENRTTDIIYQPKWIHGAVPLNTDNDRLTKCSRYAVRSDLLMTNNVTTLDCNNYYNKSDGIFDRNYVVSCNDQWIFSNEETSIASDFDIGCDRKKLTFVGTVNSIGQLIGVPWAGFLADRYGRKLVVISASVTTAAFALLRSYSQNYWQFLIFEFLEAATNSGIYSSAFMLGIELISSERRPIVGALISNFYSIGAVLMGLAMWYLKDWKLLLRVLYTPGFLFVLYIWIVPESIRWLQTKQRYEDVLNILSNAACMNNKRTLRTLIESEPSQLMCCFQESDDNVEDKMKNDTASKWSNLLKTAFTSKIIIMRTFVCSYCWVTITLVYYGITFNSVDLTIGNKYLNFVLIHLIEIPAYLISLLIMKCYSRRLSQSVILLICGTGCILHQFIPREMIWTKSTCYVINKLMITISSGIIHVYTAEIFPTELRVFLNGVCSTVSRIGCILAPQTPLLNVYFGPYAMVLLFGVVSISAGFSVLLLPETRNSALKSTVREIRKDSF